MSCIVLAIFNFQVLWNLKSVYWLWGYTSVAEIILVL